MLETPDSPSVLPDRSIDPSGSSLQALINSVSYADIVEVFGPPNGPWDDPKTDVEWWLQTPAGVATVYNWKPDLPPETPVEQVATWHIGGRTSGVVPYVAEALHADAYTRRLDGHAGHVVSEPFVQ